MRRILICLLCLATVLAALGATYAAEGFVRESGARNTIILVDNAPCEEDPDYLRFEAARLAYDQALAGASGGARGQLGAIVYSSQVHCRSFGPMSLASDAGALEEAIGSHLNAADNERRDDVADINVALRAARRMINRFDPSSDTTVVLLTSGAPDLSDADGELVDDLRAAGADFCAVALLDEDMDYRLLETVSRVEDGVEEMQSFMAQTPVLETFTVPYAGIADATVNIIFDPYDRERIENATLTGPDGVVHPLWSAQGPAGDATVSVSAGEGYIMAAVAAPQPGDWTVAVAGAEAPVDILARLNHGMRLNVSMNSFIDVGSTEHVTARLRAWQDGRLTDVSDSGIYDLSQAVLTLYEPGADAPAQTIEMTRQGESYVADITPGRLGIWTARIVVSNPYATIRADSLAFEVITPPVPTPSPTPAPVLGEIRSVKLSVEPSTTGGDGKVYLNRDAKAVTVAWEVDGAADSARGELLEDGKVIKKRLRSGDKLDPRLFKDGAAYALQVSAMPANGRKLGAEPVLTTLDFTLMPQVSPIRVHDLSVGPTVPAGEGEVYLDRTAEAFDISWIIDGGVEAIDARLLAEGREEPVLEGLASGDRIERGLLEMGVNYTLNVSAMPKNGALAGVAPASQSLQFRLCPEPEPIVGLTLGVNDAEEKDGVYQLKSGSGTLSWRVDSGDPEQYTLLVTDPEGGVAVKQTIRGDASEYPMTFDKRGDYRVTLAAKPRYDLEGTGSVSAALVLRPRLPGILQTHWYLFAGGAVLLAALVGLALFLKEKTAKRVSGAMRVTCYEKDAAMNTLVVFSKDGNGVKVNAPLTSHPAIAKLKGKKAYRLLSGVRVAMAASDASGNAPAGGVPSDVQHRPNTPLIALTWSAGKNGPKQTCYVGRYDTGYSVLRIPDGAATYAFLFCDSKTILPPTPPAELNPAPEPEPEPEPAAAPEPEPMPAPEPTPEPEPEPAEAAPDDLPLAQGYDDDLPPAGDYSSDDDLPPLGDFENPYDSDLPPLENFENPYEGNLPRLEDAGNGEDKDTDDDPKPFFM